MTKTERIRLNAIVAHADTLMNGTGNDITNVDVVEAMLHDIKLVISGEKPSALPELVQRDQREKA